jgi:hypothetical protein
VQLIGAQVELGRWGWVEGGNGAPGERQSWRTSSRRGVSLDFRPEWACSRETGVALTPVLGGGGRSVSLGLAASAARVGEERLHRRGLGQAHADARYVFNWPDPQWQPPAGP